jgi:hypothetical protein
MCLGWPQTAILLISASQVARITDVSHWRPAPVSDQVEIWNHVIRFPHQTIYRMFSALPL